MRPVRFLLLGLSLALPARAAGKDLVLRQRVYGPGGPRAAEEQTQYFSGDKVVIALSGRHAIVDMKARTMTSVEPQNKTYWVMTFDELRHMAERGAKATEALPPEARHMLGLDAPVSVRATGKSMKIAGYSAKEYAVSGGPASGTVWITEEVAVPREAREWEQFWASLGPPSGLPTAGLSAELAKLGGVPLRTNLTVSMGPRKVESGSEVVEVREAAPPAELLSVPAGFSKIAPPALAE